MIKKYFIVFFVCTFFFMWNLLLPLILPNTVPKLKQSLKQPTHFIYNPNSDILMLSGYVGNNVSNVKASFYNKIAYVKKYNITFILETQNELIDKHIYQNLTYKENRLKPLWIKKWLPHYKYVWWVDMDVILMCESDIHNVILYPTETTSLTTSQWRNNVSFIGLGHRPGMQMRFSAFSMILKNTQWARKFVYGWSLWSLNKCSCWGDQGALWAELAHSVSNYEDYGACQHTSFINGKRCHCHFDCVDKTFIDKGYNTFYKQQPFLPIQFYFNMTHNFGVQHHHYNDIRTKGYEHYAIMIHKLITTKYAASYIKQTHIIKKHTNCFEIINTTLI